MQKSKTNQPTKAQDDSVEEYTEKELKCIDKYHEISGLNFEDDEIYDLIIKYNYDDDKIMKDLKEMMRDIKLGDEFKWHEQGKKKKANEKTKKEYTNDGYQKNFKNDFKPKTQKYQSNDYYYKNEGHDGEHYNQQGNQNYEAKSRGSRGGNYTRGRGGRGGRGYNRGNARGDQPYFPRKYQEQTANEVFVEKEITETKKATPTTVTPITNDKPIVIEPKPVDKPIEIKQEKLPEAQIEIHKETKVEKEIKEEDSDIISPQKPTSTSLKEINEEERSQYKHINEQIFKESIFNPVKSEEEEVIHESKVKPIKEKKIEEKPSKSPFEKQKTEEFSLKSEIKKAPIQPTPSIPTQSQMPKKTNEYQQQTQPQHQVRYPMAVSMPPGNMMDPQGHYPQYYVMMPAMMPYEHEEGSSGTKGQKPYPSPYIYPFAHPGYPQEKDQMHPQNYDYQYNNFPYEFHPMPMGMDPSMYGQKMQQQQPDSYGFKK